MVSANNEESSKSILKVCAVAFTEKESTTAAKRKDKNCFILVTIKRLEMFIVY